MKTIQLLFAMLFAFATIQTANAQSGKESIMSHSKTQTVKVYGECGMCKSRIERTARSIDGVKSVSWDQDTKILTLEYSIFKKSVPDDLQRRLAANGHDTEKYKADDIAYQKLPDCCHYQRKQL
ncbi:heavy-metal-associated domain-containing protein [Chitinophaga sp. CC14]|uniref:heavy-metal-associated domain-containing protein n=1 Tax=Chitinophaga sp. CC14 TaxID=3029199 RepID=UPI003B7F8874